RYLIGAAFSLLCSLDGIANRCQQCRPVLFYGIECAGTYQGLDAARVNGVPVYTTAEIKQAGKSPPFCSGPYDFFNCSLTGTFHGTQAIPYGAGRLALCHELVRNRLKTVS